MRLGVWVAVRATQRRQSSLRKGDVCWLSWLSSLFARDKLMLQRHNMKITKRSLIWILYIWNCDKVFAFFAFTLLEWIWNDSMKMWLKYKLSALTQCFFKKKTNCYDERTQTILQTTCVHPNIYGPDVCFDQSVRSALIYIASVRQTTTKGLVTIETM